MKPVVLTLAALVLLFIGLDNLRQNCPTVPCDKRNFPAQTETSNEAHRVETAPQTSVTPSGLVNISGKNMNFFLMTF